MPKSIDYRNGMLSTQPYRRRRPCLVLIERTTLMAAGPRTWADKAAATRLQALSRALDRVFRSRSNFSVAVDLDGPAVAPGVPLW